MDTKDKAIVWAAQLIIAYIIPLKLYALIAGAVIVGVAIKIIDGNFAKIVQTIQDFQRRQ